MKMDSMETKRLKMVELLKDLLPEEGVFPSKIKGVFLVRTDNSFARTPKSYLASVIFLAQGTKSVFLGEETYTYDPSNYLVLSVPMPIECEAVTKPGEPILGFYISVDPAILGEMLLEMEETNYQADALPKGVYGAKLTDIISDSAVRLLETLSSPTESRILGPMIMREIIFRVLCGENGSSLHALAFRNRRFFQIARILNKIHESYDEGLDLKYLAMDAGMSTTTFHSSFKAVTNVSPLQYIKNVRLQKAKLLMTEEGLNVISAAYRVGYESPSQFNREYKRYFGITPAKDAINPRNSGGMYIS